MTETIAEDSSKSPVEETGNKERKNSNVKIFIRIFFINKKNRIVYLFWKNLFIYCKSIKYVSNSKAVLIVTLWINHFHVRQNRGCS
jgi:hypothetical protein